MRNCGKSDTSRLIYRKVPHVSLWALLRAMGQEGNTRRLQHTFTADFDGTAVHFQFVALEKQTYVWIGTSTATMKNMSLCIPSSKVRSMFPGGTMCAAPRLHIPDVGHKSPVATSPRLQNPEPSVTSLLHWSPHSQEQRISIRLGRFPSFCHPARRPGSGSMYHGWMSAWLIVHCLHQIQQEPGLGGMGEQEGPPYAMM